MKYSALLCCLLAVLASCKNDTQVIEKTVYLKETNTIKTDKEQTISKNESAELKLKRVVEFDPDFSNFDDFKENLNKYIIQIELNQSIKESTISCETLSSPHDKLHFQKNIENNLLDEMNIDISSTVAQVENIHCSVDSGPANIISAEFIIKKDVLISNSRNIFNLLVAGKNELGALVIDRDVILETLGTHLNINVEKLISNHGTITTFSKENKEAKNNANGASGGILNINAKEAFGHLSIQMQGQDGGKVTDAPKKVEERQISALSLDGEPLITQYIETCDDRGDRVRCDGATEATQCPTDGKKGLKGLKGRPGFIGRQGGNSGIASITVNDGTNFTTDITLTNGKGSLGGAGGEGGPGSLGGKAGWYNGYISQCRSVPKNGPEGEKGDNGEAGTSGRDGEKERGSYSDLKNGTKLEF